MGHHQSASHSHRRSSDSGSDEKTSGFSSDDDARSDRADYSPTKTDSDSDTDDSEDSEDNSDDSGERHHHARHSSRHHSRDKSDSDSEDSSIDSHSHHHSKHDQHHHKKHHGAGHHQHGKTSHHHKKHKKQRIKKRVAGIPIWVWPVVGFVVISIIILIWYFAAGPGSSAAVAGSDTATVGGDVGGTDVGSVTDAGINSAEISNPAGEEASAATGTADGSVSSDTVDATSGLTRANGANTAGGTAAAANTATNGAQTGSNSTATSTGGNSAASPAATGKPPSGDKIIAGFYENWGKMAIDKVPFKMYTHVFWFVATNDEKGNLDFGETQTITKAAFIKAGKAAGCKVLFSLGGWTDSENFSALFASKDLSGTLMKNIQAAIKEDSWDGVDLDWEYPGAAGNTQDFDVKNDLNNYLTFFTELRAALGKEILITTDTSSKPWTSSDGNPAKDLSKFAAQVDFFTVMTYDAWGSGEVAGPNFPLSADCSPAGSSWAYPTAMQSWIDAKVPAKQLVVGIASYGHVWKVPKFDKTGAAAGGKSPLFQKGTAVPATSTDPKNPASYAEIMGGLNTAKGAVVEFDKCTGTNYLYNSETTVFIPFDSVEAVKLKGGVSKTLGLGGCNMFALDLDSSSADLTQAMIDAC